VLNESPSIDMPVTMCGKTNTTHDTAKKRIMNLIISHYYNRIRPRISPSINNQRIYNCLVNLIHIFKQCQLSKV
jgi:hypothetical protein